jgi:hypothetical protein
VEGLAVGKRQVPVGQLNRRLGGHHRPRGIEGTQPGRISLVWNVETPTGSGQVALSGGPTVRNADPPCGNRMAKKRMPVGRKVTGNRGAWRWLLRHRLRITGRIRAAARTRKGADVAR